MLPFEDFVRARGAGLVQLGYALSGNPHTARQLALEALVRARGQWARIQERPAETIEQDLVQAYVAWWRRPLAPRADHPLATLSRTERAVLVLRHSRKMSEAEIADTVERSSNTVWRILQNRKLNGAELDEFVNAMLPPDGLFDRIEAKARALSRKRIAIGTGLAAIVLGAAAVIGTHQANRPQATPETVPSSIGPIPMRMVPASFVLPDFPYEATYLPRDPGPPVVYKTTRELGLEYVDVSVVVTPNEPQLGGTPEELTVGGAPARLYTGPTSGRVDLTVVWHPAQQWLRVHTFGIGRDETLRIANGLRPGRVPMTPPPFQLTVAPQTFLLLTASSDRLCVGPGSDLTAGPFGVCVQLLDADGLEDLPVTRLQRTTIEGKRVDLVDFPTRQSELRLYLDAGKVLVLTQNALTMGTKLSADDMVTFAASIRIGTPSS